MLPPMLVKFIESVYLFLNFVEIGSFETNNQGYVLLMVSDVELTGDR